MISVQLNLFVKYFNDFLCYENLKILIDWLIDWKKYYSSFSLFLETIREFQIFWNHFIF